MNLINVIVRKLTGSKLEDAMIIGHGRDSITQWAVDRILEKGAFEAPCVVEGFVYEIGGGWTQLQSVFMPQLES
jgi:hypothetical protein